MKSEKYIMSFTTGGLFHQESVKVAELYLNDGDWKEVRETIMKDNLLQVRTLSSSKRVSREICLRLGTLDANELKFLVEGTIQEQNYLLWLAICRRHRFIREFAVEIIRERYLTLRHDLALEDFDAFFHAKSQWSQDLEKITPATRKKLRQVLFRILREADLLTADYTINPATLTPSLAEMIGQKDQSDLYIFPVMETELKGWVQ